MSHLTRPVIFPRRGSCRASLCRRASHWPIRLCACDLLRAASQLLAMAMFLSACGGGGGGGSSPVTPSPPCVPTHDQGCLSPAQFNIQVDSLAGGYQADDRFKNQWGLSTIKADRAYAHIALSEGAGAAPGSDVSVGFLDTGIDQAHPLFAGKTITEERLFGTPDETGEQFSHGTAVASVAAAPRLLNVTNAGHGVAWGADIVMFAIPTSSDDPPYSPVSFAGLRAVDDTSESMFRSALDWRDGARAIDFLNLSIGREGIIDDYSETDLRNNFGDAIAAMAQQGVADKTVLVWAAGNAHGNDCAGSTNHCVGGKIDAVSVEVLPGLVARIPELRGHAVAVAAVSEDGMISNFSNRCGIAAEWCLAAPGDHVLVAYYGPRDGTPGFRGVGRADGTSFAAPMVTGGLAVMKHLFRGQLSNTDLLARLFATADSSGTYADRDVYGHGLMDLGAATSPVGAMSVALGDRIDSTRVDLQTSQLQFGAAFGDGFRQSLAGRELAALDILGAPFWFDLGAFTAAVTGPSMTARLHDFMTPAPDPQHALMHGAGFAAGDFEAIPGTGPARLRLGLLETRAGAERGHLALAGHALALTFAGRNGLSATAFTTEGVFGQAPASGASLSWRPADSPLGLRAGWMGEQETLLGSMAEGAFGTLAADAVFVGVEADTDLGKWQIGVSAEAGTVNPVARSGLIAEIAPLTTSAFALHAGRPLADGGTLRFSVSQPLRVEHGHARFSVPVGRTQAGEVVRRPVAADLAPSGRQIDIAAKWHRPLTIGDLRLGAVWTHEPGHRATAGPELTLLSGWRYAF